MKTVVVGASTGLGRCIGVGFARRGAQVALLARSKDKLDAAAAEAGEGAVAVACDATDENSCRAAIGAAAEQMGGIDSLVYAAAAGPLVKLRDADPQTWRQTFDINVLGATMITAAAIDHLRESRGTALYMSTTGASFTPPWPGMGIYHVTKAALDKLVESWRAEHPGVGFTRMTIGECSGGDGDGRTQFNVGWDDQLKTELAPIWIGRNYMGFDMIDVEHLVSTVFGVLSAGSSMQIPSLTVIPRVLGAPPQMRS
jgi:NAD(P)-dependent dehydrogenase (short-subunit alcohol dehydrogenase family)